MKKKRTKYIIFTDKEWEKCHGHMGQTIKNKQLTRLQEWPHFAPKYYWVNKYLCKKTLVSA